MRSRLPRPWLLACLVLLAPAARGENPPAAEAPRHRAPAHAAPARHAAPVPVVQPKPPVHALRPEHPAAATHAPPPAAAVVPPAAPAAPAGPPKGTATGLPLPRFAALRSDEVNLRAGPGTRYPIDWVYKRRDLPVEIEREFEVWRLVRDPDGVKGWVHQATLTGRRTFIVTGAERILRAAPSAEAAAVAKLKPGVIGRFLHCGAGADWCRVQVEEYRGWLQRQDFWGSLEGEAID
jgi:SH3-like domain-containing protein